MGYGPLLCGSMRPPTVRKTIVFVTHDLEEAIALADEVVVLSAGPAARIVARHPVPLERPRDLMELRTATAFVDLYRAIWAVLREEVIKSQRGTGMAARKAAPSGPAVLFWRVAVGVAFCRCGSCSCR